MSINVNQDMRGAACDCCRGVALLHAAQTDGSLPLIHRA